FTQWDFIALVEQYGIAYHEREHGQLFCDESARDILDMLLAECDKAGVSLVKGCVVESISYSSSYQINTAQGVYQTESLVIATGGLSIPTMGSSGFGYDVARQFGLKVLPQRAGLVPFAFSDRIKGVTERLSGIAIPVSMTSGERTFSEQMLFTHRGLSGPVVLQISNYWQPGESVTIDLLPGVDAIAWLLSLKKVHPKGSLKNLLAKRLPKKLVLELVTLYWAEWGERIIAELPDHQLNQIARLLNGWVLRPAGTEGYRTAEVTLGGVDTDELSSKTLECKRQPGLYFIGEVIDVTGHLGGFNFQWAWSSGYAAGQYS
ncbi:MAG: NAD(P)/FAD-dependent oxidoreductase, partial [Sedimenticola sp.]|nr:NAD(P)/FAD-dependent oxidoreductase [Sedimenticola sp.]